MEQDVTDAIAAQESKIAQLEAQLAAVPKSETERIESLQQRLAEADKKLEKLEAMEERVKTLESVEPVKPIPPAQIPPTPERKEYDRMKGHPLRHWL